MTIEIDTVFRSRAHSRSLVLSALRVFAEELRGYFRRRATRRALDRLTQTELTDIGLVRTHDGYKEIHQDRYGAYYWNR